MAILSKYNCHQMKDGGHAMASNAPGFIEQLRKDYKCFCGYLKDIIFSLFMVKFVQFLLLVINCSLGTNQLANWEISKINII